jgi:hypothetical protein
VIIVAKFGERCFKELVEFIAYGRLNEKKWIPRGVVSGNVLEKVFQLFSHFYCMCQCVCDRIFLGEDVPSDTELLSGLYRAFESLQLN